MAEFSIIIYNILMGVLLIWNILKYKQINTTITCLSLYFISALTSIYFFYNGTYNYNKLNIIPILFAYACIIITFIPVFRYDNVKNKYIRDNQKTYKIVYYTLVFFSLISVEPFLENIIHLPSVIANQNALADIYNSRAEGDTTNEYLSWIGRKFFWINFLLKDILPILLFYYLARWNKYDKWIIIGSALSIINPIIHGFALGGRSTIINSAFYLIFVYILFRSYLKKYIRTTVDKILIIGGVGIIFTISAITIARFNSAEHSIDIWTWVSLYTGEGILNFCVDLWPIDKTCNGDNTFLMVRYFLGLTNNIDIESIRATRDILGVRNLVFYTYLGTIYYDFNKIGTFIFVSIFSFIFCKITKAKSGGFKLGQLIYLSILGKVIMMGVMFYPYSLWNDQLSLLLVLLFTWFLNIKERSLKYDNFNHNTCV